MRERLRNYERDEGREKERRKKRKRKKVMNIMTHPQEEPDWSVLERTI